MRGLSPAVVANPVARQGGYRAALVAALWLALVVAGILLLERHAATPGPLTAVSPHWPAASALELDQNGATLVLFLHPRCPCSRATLAQLAAIQATRPRLTAYVVFVVPESQDPAWAEGELWNLAQAIPGVQTVVDWKAVETRRFAARTSGMALLFDRRGTCLFSGGITSARGHAGDNLGQQAILTWLSGQSANTRRAPTYGCPLFSDETPSAPQGIL
ncbi:MAG TPA: hypothetical protein VMF30_14185 [Pirellulales bacterium]|nr:hypothetical protein [Pirellulales bacterium]